MKNITFSLLLRNTIIYKVELKIIKAKGLDWHVKKKKKRLLFLVAFIISPRGYSLTINKHNKKVLRNLWNQEQIKSGIERLRPRAEPGIFFILGYEQININYFLISIIE